MSALNLPPLPPIDGGTTGRNVLDVLAERHRELLGLAERATTGREIDVLVAELSRHLSVEEQYLYPAVRRTVPDGDRLADRELAEDHELLTILGEPEPADFDLEAVRAALRRHVEADSSELFPLLAQMVPVEDLIRIGNRVELAEEAAPTRPHPGTPSRPPWNKIVDPMVAMIDKARDVTSRRTTYIKDL
ncbi:hemerythrin domain-containing protein [Actinoplanes sp. NPDC051633]|uniref:hemerythrin domain-containing protein n=1 Tax=Actinoplanes sp. NPDC051633 TaxID=3155670 RepID=UPI00341B91A5